MIFYTVDELQNVGGKVLQQSCYVSRVRLLLWQDRCCLPWRIERSVCESLAGAPETCNYR